MAATVVDNCPGVTWSQIPPVGTEIPLGVTLVQVTAVDAAGNATTAYCPVTVVDMEPPVLACNDLHYYIEEETRAAGICSVVSSVTDNCDPDPIVTQDPPVGTCLGPGVYPVTAIATDAAGNSSSCTVTATIELLPKTLDLANPGWHLIAQPRPGDHALRDADPVVMVGAGDAIPIPFCDAVIAGWVQSPLYCWDDLGGGYLSAGCDPWDDADLRHGRGYWVMTYTPLVTMVFP